MSPIEIVNDEPTPRIITVSSGTSSKTIKVTGDLTTSDLLNNTNLLAALGAGGNLKVVDQDGDQVDGLIDEDVTELELVPVGSGKGA